jgi:hypothetical protein
VGGETVTSHALTASPGWLRSAPFDLTLIVGVALVALASGAVVVARPELFALVLFLDLWLLGYHHVVSTFTRLTFDLESLREHRSLVTWVPVVVVGGVLGAAALLGGWILATTYLYWQWFHYTRQSYGIERAYRRKAAGTAITGDPRLARWALYLLPLWGILYRSYQAPAAFLGVELKVLPVPRLVVTAVAVLAVAALAGWAAQLASALLAGERPGAHTLYVVSHVAVFSVGYLVIEDINHGWLVVNVWHNAQYILFVWMFNNNRFRAGESPRAPFLSALSQTRRWPLYVAVCLGISTVLYFGLERSLRAFAAESALPLFLIAYMAINFHHYVVDGLIWKLRKKPLRQTLDLEPRAG